MSFLALFFLLCWLFPFLQVEGMNWWNLGHLVSNRTPVRLTSGCFSWGEILLWRVKYYGAFQNDCFLVPLLKSWGIFINIQDKDLVEFPEVKLSEVYRPLYDWVTQKFLIPQTFPHWCSSNLSFTVHVFSSWQYLVRSFCSVKLWFCACLLSVLGQQFALWYYLTCGSKKTYWFFCLFSFSLVVRKSLQL